MAQQNSKLSVFDTRFAVYYWTVATVFIAVALVWVFAFFAYVGRHQEAKKITLAQFDRIVDREGYTGFLGVCVNATRQVNCWTVLSESEYKQFRSSESVMGARAEMPGPTFRDGKIISTGGAK